MILSILSLILVVIILGVVGYIFYERNYSHSLRISVKKAREMIENGIINKVVDVRTKAEWNAGHYPTAVHIPANRIEEGAKTLLNSGDHILIYCNTGTRARKAAEKLESMGYKNVHYIAETYLEL